MKITYKKFGPYQGQWVAVDLSNEKILESGKNFYVLANKMDHKKKKPKKWVMKYITPFNLYLAPNWHATSLRKT